MSARTRSAPLPATVAMLVALGAAGAAQKPSLPAAADVLAKASEYVARYEMQFSAVVSEEHYQQNQDRGRGIYLRRSLKSDVLVLNTGAGGWMGFRDVYEVDGRAVRDHDQRLTRLFVDASANSITHARQIADESARYNLGSVRRNINVPTMALSYVRAENQSRSRFTVESTARLDGVSTVVVTFVEASRPTIIRSGESDAPATGRLWIDPATGRVLRTQIKLTPAKLNATITVSYKLVSKLDLWVPTSMSETYRTAQGETINGSASYSNFRRFNVDVTTIIK